MSRSFIRFSWITLVSILLVTLAGSVVRTTGSGMGCPDWPTCFGRVIPPVSEDQLPANYRDFYVEYRKGKVEKFARFLGWLGLDETANELKANPDLIKEEPFNRAKTWTEWGNRMVGFIAGNLVLALFIWVLLKFRSHKILLRLSFLNLVLIGLNGWLGSIVVATNLVPWIITIHMFLALLSIAIQVKIIRIAQNRKFSLAISPFFKYLFYFSLVLTFVQVILGSQVRQEIDFQVKEMVSRSEWISNMEGDFLFHRSFSWVLLAVSVLVVWLNYKGRYGIPTLKFVLLLILLEFATGVLFSYAGMPAFSQPLHFLLAVLLLCVQLYSLDYFKHSRNSLIE